MLWLLIGDMLLGNDAEHVGNARATLRLTRHCRAGIVPRHAREHIKQDVLLTCHRVVALRDLAQVLKVLEQVVPAERRLPAGSLWMHDLKIRGRALAQALSQRR